MKNKSRYAKSAGIALSSALAFSLCLFPDRAEANYYMRKSERNYIPSPVLTASERQALDFDNLRKIIAESEEGYGWTKYRINENLEARVFNFSDNFSLRISINPKLKALVEVFYAGPIGDSTEDCVFVKNNYSALSFEIEPVLDCFYRISNRRIVFELDEESNKEDIKKANTDWSNILKFLAREVERIQLEKSGQAKK